MCKQKRSNCQHLHFHHFCDFHKHSLGEKTPMKSNGSNQRLVLSKVGVLCSIKKNYDETLQGVKLSQKQLKGWICLLLIFWWDFFRIIFLGFLFFITFSWEFFFEWHEFFRRKNVERRLYATEPMVFFPEWSKSIWYWTDTGIYWRYFRNFRRSGEHS